MPKEHFVAHVAETAVVDNGVFDEDVKSAPVSGVIGPGKVWEKGRFPMFVPSSRGSRYIMETFTISPCTDAAPPGDALREGIEHNLREHFRVTKTVFRFEERLGGILLNII